MAESRFSKNIRIRNKKAGYEYHFIDVYDAGIVLTGSEIKSIREGKVSLQEGYCFFKGTELFTKGINISQYKEGAYANHDPTRERKLLLRKKELEKLLSKSQEKGLTIIPTELYISSRGFAKLKIALSKGKKLFDKRNTLKEKDLNREIRKEVG